MKIIQFPTCNVKAQQYNTNTQYRYSKYCLFKSIDDFTIVFNYFNDCCIIDNKNSFNALDNKEFLVHNWFLVPLDFDEFAYAKEIKNTKLLTRKNKKIENIKTFTILPTTDCNANCAYCFEFGHRKLKMTPKVANDIVKYICENKGIGNVIRLRWFGGEPLYNQEVIDIICNGLQNNGIVFNSIIISNGYLIDKENIKKYRDLWKLQSMQITIDGINDVYNNVKNYININDENPFNTVIENIECLLQEKIRVSIRLNITENNYNDLKDAIDFLINKFKNKINIYVTPIYQLSNEENPKVFENFYLLNKYIIRKRGFNKRLTKSLNNYSCIANSGSSIVINPLGNISLCEHDIDKRVIGNIYDGIDQNAEYIQKYREYLYIDDKCPNCILYPLCLRPILCESSGVCNNLKIQKILNRQQQILEYTLKRYIREQNKKEEQ